MAIKYPVVSMLLCAGFLNLSFNLRACVHVRVFVLCAGGGGGGA